MNYYKKQRNFSKVAAYKNSKLKPMNYCKNNLLDMIENNPTYDYTKNKIIRISLSRKKKDYAKNITF